MINKKVTMLFPDRVIGPRIIQNLSSRYRLFLFVFSEEEKHFFEQEIQAGAVVTVINQERFSGEREKTELHQPLQTDGVISFMGKDWLTLQIKHDGEEWSLDPSHVENRKVAFVETIIELLDKTFKVTWINLAQGRHTHISGGKVFCNTRYGLTGFLKAVELAPGLKNLRIINICMNYFMQNTSTGSKKLPVHCGNCISAEFVQKELPYMEEQEFIRAVIRSIEGGTGGE